MYGFWSQQVLGIKYFTHQLPLCLTFTMETTAYLPAMFVIPEHVLRGFGWGITFDVRYIMESTGLPALLWSTHFDLAHVFFRVASTYFGAEFSWEILFTICWANQGCLRSQKCIPQMLYVMDLSDSHAADGTGHEWRSKMCHSLSHSSQWMIACSLVWVDGHGIFSM